MVIGHQATNIMGAHDANVRKYGEEKVNRMLYWSVGIFVLFWNLLVSGVLLSSN